MTKVGCEMWIEIVVETKSVYKIKYSLDGLLFIIKLQKPLIFHVKKKIQVSFKRIVFL